MHSSLIAPVLYAFTGIGFRGGYHHWGPVGRAVYSFTFPVHAFVFWLWRNRCPLWSRSEMLWKRFWNTARPILILSVLWRFFAGYWPWELLDFGDLLRF